MIRANVHPPDLVMGDVYAQITTNRTGETRLVEMIERFGLERVRDAASALQDYSERLARDAVAAIPDGVYEAEDWVDDNGFTDEPLRVALRITVAGDQMDLDFGGSAPQTRGIINSPSPRPSRPRWVRSPCARRGRHSGR